MGSCLTQEQFKRLLYDRLDPLECDGVGAHVQECGRCQQTLEGLTREFQTAYTWSTDTHVTVGEDRLLEELKARGPLVGLDESSVDGNANLDVPAGRWDGILAEGNGDRSFSTGVCSLPVIDGFRIVREIGRGGMGVVFEAFQERLHRRVALKILLDATLSQPGQVERFRQEARAAACLQHPNIVPVYHVGEQDGLYFFVMQYIEGLGLNAVLGELRRQQETAPDGRRSAVLVSGVRPDGLECTGDQDDQADGSCTTAGLVRSLKTGGFVENRPASSNSAADPFGQSETASIEPAAVPGSGQSTSTPSRSIAPALDLSSSSQWDRTYYQSVARIGRQVAEALSYANRHHVLHRDVKPSNLLLDRKGNVWVADFGLAKTADSDDLTSTGEIIGTLRYMAPERFQGRCDAASDVYSLGLTLYELIALRPAFDATDRHELIDRVMHQEPVRLKKLAPRIPRDLDTIILKAIAREPSRRYAAAGDLADDLSRFLEGRPIRARQAAPAERVWLWCYRNPWVAAFVVVLTIGTVASAFMAILARKAEHDASADRNRAVAAGQAESEARARAQAAEKTARVETDKASAINRFLTEDLLIQAEPEHNAVAKNVTVLDVLDRAAEKVGSRFGGQPQIEAALRRTIAATYHGLGAFEKSEKHWRAAADLERPLEGSDPAEAAKTAGEIGHNLYHLGRYDEAIELLRRSNDGLSRLLGPDHPDTLHAIANLALAYRVAGRDADALPLLEDTLKRLKAMRAANDHETLNAENNLALAYLDAGRTRDALPLFEESLVGLSTTLGPDHPDTLSTMNNLAMAYHEQGRFADAVPLFEKSLAQSQIKQGLDHSDTLSSMHNLATAYREAGRLAESLPLAEKALSLRSAKLGPTHPETLISLNNLATTYRAAGRLSEALPLYEQTLKARRQRLGLDHPSVLGTMNGLAMAYLDAHRIEDASNLMRDALLMCQSKLRPDHPLMLLSMDNLTRCHLAAGKPALAESVARACLAQRTQKAPDDWQTFQTRGLLGASLSDQKQFERALPLLLSAYEGMKARESKIPASSKSRLVEAGQRITALHESWGKKQPAEQWQGKPAK